jgi:protein SCO1/2
VAWRAAAVVVVMTACAPDAPARRFPLHGQVLAVAPDAALIDQDDQRRALADWRGTPTLITFIYTRCPLPNFCPLMDRHFKTIQRAAREDPALDGRIRLISISFDPDYDTPAVLADHASRLQADPAVWTFLTGDRITVDRVAAKFGVGVLREEGSADITHNLRTILVGADGRISRIYGGNDWTPSTVLADLRAAVRRP